MLKTYFLEKSYLTIFAPQIIQHDDLSLRRHDSIKKINGNEIQKNSSKIKR